VTRIKITQAEFDDFKNFYDTSIVCIDVMRADMKKVLDLTEKFPEDECWRRLVIRLGITYIDSMCYQLRTATIKLANVMGIRLSQNHTTFLTGFKTTIKRGKPKKKRVNVEFLEKCKRSLSVTAEVLFDLELEETKEEDWDKLKAVINLRHRITHPKSPLDLSVTIDEYKKAAESCYWYSRVFIGILDRIGQEKIRLRPQ